MHAHQADINQKVIKSIEFSAIQCNRGAYKHTQGTPLRKIQCQQMQITSVGLMN